MEQDSLPRHDTAGPIDIDVSSSEQRLALLRQIAASRTFLRSPRLTKFLEFICLRMIEGRAKDINEQQIGVHVFGRSETYNAADDSVVRTQARLLRQRLEEYFEHECPTAPMVVTIPKGGYVPIFEPRMKAVAPIATPPEPKELPLRRQFDNVPSLPKAPHRRSTFSQWMLITMALLLLGLTAYLWYARGQPEAASNALWSELFIPGRTVLIVPSDDALVLFQEFTGAPVALSDYLSGSYLTRSTLPGVGKITLNTDWFASHQYTSMADLNLALRLGRLPQAVKANVETRNARVLRIDDLKSRNVVLIGGIGGNPWVGLFTNRLNFDLNWDWKASEGYVLNKHPQPGETPIYRDTLVNGTRKSYGVLAFLPGIDGNGKALLFEGTGMAGTESAADLPFSSTLFQSFAKTIGVTPNHMPYFEVLLETTSVGGNAPEAHIVTYRLIQP